MEFVPIIFFSDDTPRYNEVEWDKLLPDVKAAAEKLGYDKQHWDGDEEISIEDYDWEDLDAEQKAAAVTLGYTPDKWDD